MPRRAKRLHRQVSVSAWPSDRVCTSTSVLLSSHPRRSTGARPRLQRRWQLCADPAAAWRVDFRVWRADLADAARSHAARPPGCRARIWRGPRRARARFRFAELGERRAAQVVRSLLSVASRSRGRTARLPPGTRLSRLVSRRALHRSGVAKARPRKGPTECSGVGDTDP